MARVCPRTQRIADANLTAKYIADVILNQLYQSVPGCTHPGGLTYARQMRFMVVWLVGGLTLIVLSRYRANPKEHLRYKSWGDGYGGWQPNEYIGIQL